MQKKRQALIAGILLATLSISVTGCKKEPTQEEVEQSEYYTDLLSQYNKVKKQNKKLEAALEEATAESPEDIEVEALLDKVSRDSLIKVEVAYGDTTTGSVFTENKGVLEFANALASSADVIDIYTPDDIRLNYEQRYTYTLYDEDNSVFELEVYDGDYVIFKDLPERVFYVYKASKFGDAFLERREYYPTLSARAKMAESSIIVRGEKAYDSKTAYKVVSYINSMKKETISGKNIKELKTNYLFYYHGEVLTLGIGKKVIMIQDSEKKTFYKTDEETVKGLKNIFSGKS
ncbi:MAG: hypothetical protein KH020_08135 [Clostridiales bacterium]|nr:hypothetical protein [Clostridiales bacterium]